MKGREPRAHDRPHRDRQIEEVAHDPYHARGKPAEPAVCPQCGLVYHKGRWQRASRAAKANEHVCPACHRINDRAPAGYVTLAGAYMTTHGEEVLRLVRNEEAREAQDHPLQRIMGIENKEGVVTVTTTDVHVARRIGDALRSAFQGELVVKYSPDEYLVRVNWTR
ncbi:MAG: BCAM0308 family protein [Betaproteobacteria bacterium]